MNKTILRFSKAITFIMVIFSASYISASDLSWHEKSENYNVYLGIVPADMIKTTPSLVDNDKNLHGGVSKLSSNAQHVMITIFNRSTKKRINNATVIAEVSSGTLLGRKKLEKPLEKMNTSGQLNYANYFDMPKKGKYKIELEIYESNKNGSDEITFFYDKQ